MAALVLLAEDSPEDVEAVRRTLTRSRPEVRLEVVQEGSEVIGRLVDTLGDLPDLVLLDLNIPGLDGLGVLRAVRARPGLASLPVVVLTSSTNPRDVAACYRAGANSYLFKPVDLALFQVVLRGTFDYWLGTVAAGRENRNAEP